MMMIRTLSGLSPGDEESVNLMHKVKIGDRVDVEIERPRSHKALARWWALAQMIADNSDEFKSKEQVSDYLKIRAGHCSSIVSKATGEVYLIADSIAFSKLSEDEFQDLWSRAVKATCEDILPTITEPEIEDEILRIVGCRSEH